MISGPQLTRADDFKNLGRRLGRVKMPQIFESPYTSLVVALVLGALALSGKFNVTATQIILAVALVVVIVGLRQQPWQLALGYSAVAAGILLVLCYFFRPDAVAIDLSKNEGVLIPAHEPMPELARRCRLPENALAVFIGSNLSWSTRFPHTVIEMGNEPMLVIDRDGNRNLKVTVLRIFDDRDDIIARIDADGFWVQNTLRKKRPDQSTLIVYDHNDNEVLKLRYINNRAITVEGVFRHATIKPHYLEVTPSAAIQMPNHNQISDLCFGEMGADISLGTTGSFSLGRVK